MQVIDQKIDHLVNVLGASIPYIAYYPNTRCDMYKISNPYTDYNKETIVLCRLDEGFEHAIDLAIPEIAKLKKQYFDL